MNLGVFSGKLLLRKHTDAISFIYSNLHLCTLGKLGVNIRNIHGPMKNCITGDPDKQRAPTIHSPKLFQELGFTMVFGFHSCMF